ncbi:hypothetical protein, partial [Pseudomonas sp. IPO3778]|uniref:hypothetical protein n=1 Tax=Pseudomonas sp. IPO3778 TaxID=2726976 RepID=UPI001C4B1199
EMPDDVRRGGMKDKDSNQITVNIADLFNYPARPCMHLPAHLHDRRHRCASQCGQVERSVTYFSADI